jgi:hypothetical protein
VPASPPGPALRCAAMEEQELEQGVQRLRSLLRRVYLHILPTAVPSNR